MRKILQIEQVCKWKWKISPGCTYRML